MKRKLSIVIFSLMLTLTTIGFNGAIASAQPVSVEEPEIVVVRVFYNNIRDIELLSAYDLFEYNNLEQKYVLVAIESSRIAEIRRLGFRTQIDEILTSHFNPTGIIGTQIGSIPGYACYRTVEETYSSAAALASSYPGLATWTDIGDSWEKVTTTNPDLAGYDMMILKLTNSAITGDKPKLFISAAIHAREYTTAELAIRYAEYLVTNYNTDADVTWLLNYNEIHFMFYINPDGRKKAEVASTNLWRKNTDRDDGCNTTTTYGTDLNRNFTYQWGTGGSSTNPCDPTYRGPSAGSEPETQVVQNYLTSIFPDQRNANDAAPATTTGVYLDLHSSGGLVIWPWGYTTTTPPNATQLQTLGRKFAYFNGYRSGQITIILYVASGGTIDYSYGELGIASYTFELGTQFLQSCTTFTNTILPNNLPALIYAAKAARTPYQTPLGPDAINLVLSNNTVPGGTSVTLTASITDTRYNNSNGTEAVQPIAAAEYYIDTPPWMTGAVAIPMTAVDGTFNTTSENVSGTINTSPLSPTRHIIFVRGRDANGNWGAFSATFVTITPTAVRMKWLTAKPAGNTIQVRWQTASEDKNLGFNIYRSTTYKGKRTKINAELIPSLVHPGSLTGARYSFIDSKIKMNQVYYYWLEDVDIYGNPTLHGPVKAKVAP